MTTVSRDLPNKPHLDVAKRLARELLAQWRSGVRDAHDRIRRRHPKFERADDAAVAAGPFRLSDAQLVVAREYGMAHWAELKQRIAANTAAQALATAIRANDVAAAVQLVAHEPQLLHVPLVSGNWGPPMSHAANFGHLEIIKAMAALGAKDFQHALGRAVLQGRTECARWLLEHGDATLEPGLAMGACEGLNVEGMRFLAQIGSPLTNDAGDALGPLAMTLETYSRNPKSKHEILEIFARSGYDLPDTPIMAFHRGSRIELERHLRRDPKLLERRFTLAEIYPAECGCGGNGPGMHWTPIAGTTLLHLAFDFHELDIAAWLLHSGADVDARADVDADGFGGHTPLFNALVCGPWHDDVPTRVLLGHGASTDARASLRKFLDWIEEPRWHVARDVTAAEWARGFPDRSWSNGKALRLLDGEGS
ncbi:MAG TPA: ankyrin repeat domain-containing protein [Gammaproteobacteria bacterium]|nr:ankyrin repeat domain-containing protein [Gammaproteobacteria bacterium]